MKTCGRCKHKGFKEVSATRVEEQGKQVEGDQVIETITVPACLKEHSLKGAKWKCKDYEWNKGIIIEQPENTPELTEFQKELDKAELMVDKAKF